MFACLFVCLFVLFVCVVCFRRGFSEAAPQPRLHRASRSARKRLFVDCFVVCGLFLVFCFSVVDVIGKTELVWGGEGHDVCFVCCVCCR